MSTPTDLHWLRVALVISEQSKCCKREVGAVVVNGGRIVSSGYNGAPRGFPDKGLYNCKDFCPAAIHGLRASSNGYASCVAVHAEINALLFANRDDLSGATVYVPYSICINCAKAIANSGICRVVWVPAESKELDNRSVRNLFGNCGLESVELTPGDLV